MDERWLLSRRALLGGLAGLGASTLLKLPRVRADDAPKRFIVVHVPEGMWSKAVRPVVGAATFGDLLAPLEPYRQHVTVLNNLYMASRAKGPGVDGHPRAVLHMLTGTPMRDDNNAGGPSVDQRIAATIGTSTKYPSLQFADRIVYGDLNGRPIWSADGHSLPAMQDPLAAYKRLFANLAPPTSQAPVFDLRKSALDHSLEELASLSARLGKSDRERLESYNQSLREIERRLKVAVPLVCESPMTPGALDVKAEANYPEIGRLQMDLMVAALQCDLTHVISLQWGNSNDQCSYSWLGINTLGHDLAHNNDDCDPTGDKKKQVFIWYAKQFAYLLEKLKTTPEGDGSMLDNTVILWASEFGECNGHGAKNLMWMLMGNLGGRIRGGRVLDCGGRSVNDLHLALCNLFGDSGSTFGDPEFCGGALDLS